VGGDLISRRRGQCFGASLSGDGGWAVRITRGRFEHPSLDIEICTSKSRATNAVIDFSHGPSNAKATNPTAKRRTQLSSETPICRGYYTSNAVGHGTG
jgi:hypothetical protein